MFKELANLGSLMKQAQQVGSQMGAMSEQLKTQRATGAAGGGMVEVEVNGLMEVLRCSIDESLIQGGDRELLEDLVTAAMNQTILKGKQLHAEVLGELTGGIQLPGLQEAMAKFMGTEGGPDADDVMPNPEVAEETTTTETDDPQKPEG